MRRTLRSHNFSPLRASVAVCLASVLLLFSYVPVAVAEAVTPDGTYVGDMVITTKLPMLDKQVYRDSFGSATFSSGHWTADLVGPFSELILDESYVVDKSTNSSVNFGLEPGQLHDSTAQWISAELLNQFGIETIAVSSLKSDWLGDGTVKLNKPIRTIRFDIRLEYDVISLDGQEVGKAAIDFHFDGQET